MQELDTKLDVFDNELPKLGGGLDPLCAMFLESQLAHFYTSVALELEDNAAISLTGGAAVAAICVARRVRGGAVRR